MSYTPEIITDGPLAANVVRAYAETDFQHTTPVNVVKANLGWAAGKWEVNGFAQYESSFYGLTAIPNAPVVLSGQLQRGAHAVAQTVDGCSRD